MNRFPPDLNPFHTPRSVLTKVGIGSPRSPARPADRTIAQLARGNGGIYDPALHLAIYQDEGRVPDGNYEGYVESHVGRLEALRRVGIAEHLGGGQDAPEAAPGLLKARWRLLDDLEERARDYYSQRSKPLGVRVLSLIILKAEIAANAATWLDRELVSDAPVRLRDSGFGREAHDALARRRQWLLAKGLARGGGDSGFICRPTCSQH